MGSVNQIGLRSKRKPGYSWVDNEIASCYQAIVGPDATWVYHNLARQVQEQDREPSVTFALRDMAEWTGRSKDTVQRCLAVLELVGLIAVRRGAKAKAWYDLMDVKELVLSHGGVYDVRKSSFVLPDATEATLKAAVKELRARLARKQLSVDSDQLSATAVSHPVEAVPKSVALSDRLPVDNLFLPVALSDRIAAQEDASVALGPTASSYREISKKKEKNNTPLPPQAGECGAPILTDVEAFEATVDQVMYGCGFTARRMRPVIRDVLKQEIADSDKPLVLALSCALTAMVDAWDDFKAASPRLRYTWGPNKFFSLGYWRERDSWPWDGDVMKQERMQAEARVGTYVQ